MIATTTATTISIVLCVGASLLKRVAGDRFVDHYALATTVLFQFATVVGAMLVVYGSERRAKRYAEIVFALEESGRLFDALESWDSILQLVSKIERILLSELLEWKVLMRHRKLTR